MKTKDLIKAIFLLLCIIVFSYWIGFVSGRIYESEIKMHELHKKWVKKSQIKSGQVFFSIHQKAR